MKKFHFEKHGNLFSMITTMNIQEFDRSMDNVTRDEFTAEGFISSMLSKVSSLGDSRISIPRGNIIINRKVLKKNEVKKYMRKVLFIKLAAMSYPVDNNFTGNRGIYLKDLLTVYQKNTKALELVMPELNNLLEASYAVGKLNNPMTIDDSFLQEAIADYNLFMSKFFDGDADHVTVGDTFDNNNDIVDYLAHSVRINVAPARLKKLRIESSSMSERLKLLKSKNIDASSQDLKNLSKLVMRVAIAHSNIAKTYYLLDNNMEIARTLYEKIKTNTSK